MKKLSYTFYLFIFLSISTCVKEKKVVPNNAEFVELSGYMAGNDISTIFSNDGNLLMCANDSNKITLYKTSQDGALIWTKKYNFDNNYSTTGLIQTVSNDIFICTSSDKNYSTSLYDILLIKTNDIGDTIWTKTYGTSDNEYFKSIIKTSDGNILISCETKNHTNNNLSDVYVLKVNTDGDVIWSSIYEDLNSEEIFSVLETQNGEYLLTGQAYPANFETQIYLLKINSSGEKLWDKKMGEKCTATSTIELSNGDLVMSGKVLYKGDAQQAIVKTDNLGNPIWSKIYGDNKHSEYCTSIKEKPDGTFLICGYSTSINNYEVRPDILLSNIDQNGNKIWSKIFGSSKDDIAQNMLLDANENIIITGHTTSDLYTPAIFIVKVDKNGNYY